MEQSLKDTNREGDISPGDAYKSGYVAIIGKPNVGKATLFNPLIGQKLSIVTPKAQTTRTNVLGIATSATSQMIFLDTPGVLKPKYRLQEAMGRQLDHSIKEADVALLMVDACRFEDTFDEHIKNRLQDIRIPLILALNKADLISSDDVIVMISQLVELESKDEVIPISALYGRNLDRLRSLVK